MLKGVSVKVMPGDMKSSERPTTMPDSGDTTHRGSLLHRGSWNALYSAIANTEPPDPTSPKELSEVLRELDTNCSTTFQLSSKIECMAPCRAGLVVGLDDGNVALVRFGMQHEIFDMKDAMHTAEVTCIAVTPDSKFGITGSVDKSIKIWSLEEYCEIAVLNGHKSRVQCLVMTPDGKRIASGSRNGEIKVWNFETFEEEATLEGHEDRVSRLVITPDGKTMVSGSWDNTLKVWSLDREDEIATMEGHIDYINCLVITPDGKFVISGSEDETVKVWSLSEMAEVATLSGHTDRITSLVLDFEGKFVVSASEDATMKIWSLQTYTEIAHLTGHTADVTCLAITPDAKHIVSGSYNGEVKIWSIAELCEVANLTGNTEFISCVSITIDGKFVISGCNDGNLKIWSLEEGHEEVVFKGHSSEVNCVAVTPDGKQLVSGSKDNNLRVWSLEDFTEIAVLRGHTDFVNCLAITPDGKKIVSGSVDNTVKVWSLSELRKIATLSGHTHRVYCLVITPNSKRVITGSWDKTLKVWSLEDLREIAAFTGHTQLIYSLAVTPDGNIVTSGSSNGELKVWSLVEMKEIVTLVGHMDEITCMSITSDGRFIVSGSWDKSVKIWNLETLSLVCTLSGHLYIVYCLAITPDDKYAVSGSVDRTLKVWSIGEMREVATMFGHTADINCLAITPDGKHVASGSMDRTVKIWSLIEMREIATFTGHTDRVYCLTVTPDGKRVISGSFDHTVACHDMSGYLNQIEVSGSLPTTAKASALFASNVTKLMKGAVTHKETYLYRVLPYNFNSLHVSAYFNQPEACKTYLKAGAQILRGTFGSPLSVALKRNTSKCIDVFLNHLKNVCKNESSWKIFRAFSDDLPLLLSCNSPLVVRVIGELLCPYTQANLPQFIAPIRKLPVTTFLPTRYVQLRDFGRCEDAKLVESDTELVEFSIGLFRWNFASGSNSSLMFLKALGCCRNRKVLTTDFMSTLVETKWNHFFRLTLALTVLYSILLLNLVGLLFNYWDQTILCLTFATINMFLMLYEIIQMIGTCKAYWVDLWNLVDLTRGSVCLLWAAVMLSGLDYQYLRLVVMCFCFLRGFTYFRTFTATRIFVYITIQVICEIYSFLLIVAYSVMCFGLLSSEMTGDDGFSVSWTSAFNQLMGNSDTSNYNWIQWAIFMCTSILNVIIMLNLLVSILGDAYDKAQMSLKENDVHEMLGLVIEYESIMFWKRNSGSEGVLVHCKRAEEKQGEEEWEGRINKIAKSIRDENQILAETLMGPVSTHLKEIEHTMTIVKSEMSITQEKVKLMHEEMGMMQDEFGKRLGTMEKKMSGVEGKLDKIITALTNR